MSRLGRAFVVYHDVCPPPPLSKIHRIPLYFPSYIHSSLPGGRDYAGRMKLHTYTTYTMYFLHG